MWLDAIALVILGLFAGMGAARGTLAAGMQLAGLVVAYAAAVLLGPRGASAVARTLGLPEIAGLAVAGVLAFAVAFFLMGGLSALLRRAARPLGSYGRSRRDRFGGGAFGALRGALVVLLLCWLALWADALRATGVAPDLPALEGSRAAAATSATIEAGVEAAFVEAGALGRVGARIAARPGTALVGLRETITDPRFEALVADRLFWTQLEHGAVDAALNQPSFVSISHDPALLGQLAALGAIEPETAADRAAFRRVAGETLRELAPRLRGLRTDPALRELLEDPEVVAMLQNGDSWRLLGHRGFRDLASRVAAE